MNQILLFEQGPLLKHMRDNGLTIVRGRSTASLRLVCFPHAGSHGGVYRTWLGGLAPTIEVIAVTLPGRAQRIGEPPHRHWPDMLHDVTSMLRPFIDRPCALFGHSFGALVAFEIARWINHEWPERLAQLFVSAMQAPSSDRPRGDYYVDDAAMMAKMKAWNATPSELLNNSEMLKLLLPAIKADCELVETYQYVAHNPLLCPITAFGGREDEHYAPEKMSAWAKETRGVFALHTFSGGHFFIEAHALKIQRTMLAAVGQYMAKARVSEANEAAQE